MAVVLVMRDSQGKVNAFLNVCRHRSNRLCRADMGNAETFTCAYHGWTYSNEGRLVGVPYFKEAYFGELDREQWGLIPVAQLDSYKGLYFPTFDSAAPPPSVLDDAEAVRSEIQGVAVHRCLGTFSAAPAPATTLHR